MRNDREIAMQRQAVVAEAKTWLKTPYHHSARIKGAGVDCAQILIAVYSACGIIEAFDPGYYPSDWMLHRSEERYLSWIDKYAQVTDTPLPGDIVLYRFGRCISHGGIVIEWPTIIHAHMPDRQVTLAEGDKGSLGKRLHLFYTLWGKNVRNS